MGKRNKGCDGKLGHVKILSAQIAAKKYKNKQMKVYLCTTCKKWHVGRSNRNHDINSRLDQLLGKVDHSQKN